MQKKDLFIRNLTNKALGYALGRGLTLQDSCTVDNIIAEVERSDYSAHRLNRCRGHEHTLPISVAGGNAVLKFDAET